MKEGTGKFKKREARIEKCIRMQLVNEMEKKTKEMKIMAKSDNAEALG